MSVILLFSLPIPAYGATQPGTPINNTAQAAYSVGLTGITSNSNTVTTTVAVTRSSSTLEFLQYAPASPSAVLTDVTVTDYSSGGTIAGPFAALAAPVDINTGAAINLAAPVPLVSASAYHQGEALFLKLTDLDQNLDFALAETVLVSLAVQGEIEAEAIRLTETGPNTGIFTGYIQSAFFPVVPADGLLNVKDESQILAAYTDISDGTDVSAAAALVDPFGKILNTANGLPVDGATVTLINVATGLPASVKGDDGVSGFPSTVTSGGTANDTGGKLYTFPSGGYRFPFVAPGTYRLDVVPPAGYVAPSTVPTASIQALPGGPFAIVNPGSRNEPFVINPGPALNIDIPVDPLTTGLYVRKSASKDVVAVGDFLQYLVTVENTGIIPVANVSTTDKLPLGFRYQKGSARVGGVKSADPSISTDGRTMTFALGAIGAGNTVSISYVVEVAAGARLGLASNFASASDGVGTSSNLAKATVKVREDLLRSKTIIMGRVIAGACDANEEDEGMAGARIYLEDGTYVITDENGMYHFEGIDPGTHVVQLDIESVPPWFEVTPCEENSRFAGRSFSQFVDLQGGTMWRADFHIKLKPKLKGKVDISLKSNLEDDTVTYTMPVKVGPVAVRNLRVTLVLPDGSSYTKGSSKINGKDIPDPDLVFNSLIYKFGAVPEGWAGEVYLETKIPLEGESIDLTTRAIVTFDTPEAKNLRTPIVDNSMLRTIEEEKIDSPEITVRPHFDELGAEIKGEDKEVLDQIIESVKESEVIHLFVTGHTDSNNVRKRSWNIFADNYALSLGRAKSVASYLADKLELPPSKITITGKGSDEPIATNKIEEGRALNRRVDIKLTSKKIIKHYKIVLGKEKSETQSVDTTGMRPGQVWEPEEEKKLIRPDKKEYYDNDWFKDQGPGFEWLWPGPEYYPPIPALNFSVKHDPKKKLKVILNGKEVNALNFEGMTKDSNNLIAVSRWRGVHLIEGDNLFELINYGGDDQEAERIKRVVHYSGSPVRVEVVPEKSRLTADGKTPSVVAVRLTDKDGHPARKGIFGGFKVEPPYVSQLESKALQKDPLNNKAKDTRYEVGDDGIALIELQPTTRSGEATIKFDLADGEKETKVWLKGGARDWILVGLAEGTLGYNTISGNMETAESMGSEADLYEDGRLAFFAKGMIKGEWLLTMAYDSEKGRGGEDRGLFQTIDPDSYYMLYGDGTQQDYEAASARKLYLKIEKKNLYALFGDYNTGLTVTELSRYNRSVNGLKSEMKGDKFDFNVFASDTNQAFKKDEIRGDGTSGLYYLSSSNIVVNSESITIETRDRFRSELVISSKALSRHIDYNIDYENRTIFFKEPVYSKDGEFNPIYIVVDYESSSSSDKSYNYGGRGALRTLDNKLELGVTHVHEGVEGAEGNLFGLDAKYKLDKKTDIKIEIATTDTRSAGTSNDGNAYLAEVIHRTDKMDMKVYQRRQEGGFGLGQQMGSENGTLKTGLDGTYRLSNSLNLSGQLHRQSNLSINSDRDLAEVRARYNKSDYSLHGGLRHVADKFSDGSYYDSDQINLGGSVRTWNDKLTLKADRDQALSNNNASSDYPTRTTLGADYKLTDKASLFAAHEITDGEREDANATRVGLKAMPWKGGQLNTSLDNQRTENGTRLYSNLGLKQSLQINEKWSVDGGLDRTSTLKHPGNRSVNTNVPAASGGNNDFTAISLGVSYREEKWSLSSRVENRNSDTEDKRGLHIGVNGEIRDGLGLSLGFHGFKSDTITGIKKRNGDIRFGLAYRPKVSKWIVLDRLDLLYDEQKGGSFNYDNWRIVNNLNVNYKLDWKTQLSFQYAAKYVNERIDMNDYSGYTDLMGFEGRYDITRKWDVGLHASLLHSWNSGQVSYRSGLSLGHSFVENLWVSLGYNFNGFRDRDFSRANFTNKGMFVKFRLKFDQKSARELVKWIENK
ncbi:MAG: OmpA family protein [Proteobacteria bacterium]|nr:OmpA family protein [Pseudomonadota bacterium]